MDEIEGNLNIANTPPAGIEGQEQKEAPHIHGLKNTFLIILASALAIALIRFILTATLKINTANLSAWATIIATLSIMVYTIIKNKPSGNVRFLFAVLVLILFPLLYNLFSLLLSLLLFVI